MQTDFSCQLTMRLIDTLAVPVCEPSSRYTVR